MKTYFTHYVLYWIETEKPKIAAAIYAANDTEAAIQARGLVRNMVKVAQKAGQNTVTKDCFKLRPVKA